MTSTILASNCEADQNKITTSIDGLKLNYQGRKTSRVNSEHRRRTILEASLKIVVRDGVRGVRHRAVAKEANVPLSATTYYFKDISDLITDTFTLFVEISSEKFKTNWINSDRQIRDELNSQNNFPDSKEQLAKRITELVAQYILIQLREHREYLIAERAFHLECLRNDNLRSIATNNNKFFLESLEFIFEAVGSSQAKIDAKNLLAIVLHAEFEGLIDSKKESAIDQFHSVIKRQIELVILPRN